MSKPWYRLNIDISNAIRSDFDFDQLYTESVFAGKPIGIWSYTKEQISNIINEEWISYAESLGIYLSGIMLFYRAPYFVAPDAHVDVRKNNNIAVYAINWVINPADDSEMVWFDVPTIAGKDQVTETGTPYRSWQIDEVADLEISRCCIKNIPTLVNIGIPHNVIVNSEPRWVVSIRFPIEQHVQCWDDAVAAHRKFINE